MEAADQHYGFGSSPARLGARVGNGSGVSSLVGVVHISTSKWGKLQGMKFTETESIFRKGVYPTACARIVAGEEAA